MDDAKPAEDDVKTNAPGLSKMLEMETMLPEEQKLTPAQLAEIEENKKPFLDKFKDLVDEASERQRHGTTLNPTFVNALRALYDEAAGRDKPPVAQDGLDG